MKGGWLILDLNMQSPISFDSMGYGIGKMPAAFQSERCWVRAIQCVGRLLSAAFLMQAAFGQAAFGQPSAGTSSHFEEVSEWAGLNFRHYSPFSEERHLHLAMGSGVAWLDIDQDGWPDLCFAQGRAWPPTTEQSDEDLSLDRIFRNQRGRFTDVTRETGILNARYSMGLAAADLDNDGFVDLMISCFGSHRLYRNNGDGTFDDVSSQLNSAPSILSASCTWIDCDQDGLLDLYVTNYVQIDLADYAVCTQSHRDRTVAIPCPPRKYPWPADTLYKNMGDGRFIDVSEIAGLYACEKSAGLGVVAGDFNGDQIIDLYVANDTTANFLLINDGHGRFHENAIAAGVAFNRQGEGEAGMGVSSGDVDGDGRLDLFVGNYYGESNTLYRSEAEGMFLDVTAEYGLAAPSRTRLAFGTLLADFNNDTRLDAFVANGHLSDRLNELGLKIPFRQRSQLLMNSQGARFKDASAAAGAWFQKEIVGRGCATGDFNLDGFSDIVVQDLNSPTALLQNTGDSKNQSISLLLKGRSGNRDGIGARVEVRLPDRTIVRCREGSSSYLSCNDATLVIGLGEISQAVSVRIYWPDGALQTVTEVSPGTRMIIVEGRDAELLPQTRDEP
jgi:hypothetical protein